MSNKHLTTQELDETLANFRKETLEVMASGENLIAVALSANTDTHVLQSTRCELPSDLLETVAYVFITQAVRVFSTIGDKHADKREELLKGLLKKVEEQIRSQLS